MVACPCVTISPQQNLYDGYHSDLQPSNAYKPESGPPGKPLYFGVGEAVTCRLRNGFVHPFVSPLASNWCPLHEPLPLPILLPNIGPPPAEAQPEDQDQEESTDRRTNGDEDRLVPTKPSGEAATGVLLDIWWTGGVEGVQESLVLSRVDILQSNLDKVLVGLGEVVRGREELDVWVGDFVLLAIDEVTEVYEHVGVSD